MNAAEQLNMYGQNIGLHTLLLNGQTHQLASETMHYPGKAEILASKWYEASAYAEQHLYH